MQITDKDELFIIEKLRHLKKRGFGELRIEARENKNMQVKLTVTLTNSDVFFVDKEIKFDNRNII